MFESLKKKFAPKKETIDVNNLDEARRTYARLTNKSRHIFKRVNKESLKEAREKYQEELQNKLKEVYEKNIPDEIKEALNNSKESEVRLIYKELNDDQKDALAEAVTKITIARQSEEARLTEEMISFESGTKASKFRKFLQKHSKLRMILSYSLIGTGVASAAVGFIPGVAISAGLRAPLSGVGTTLGVSKIWDKVRSRVEQGKKLKELKDNRKKYKKMAKEGKTEKEIQKEKEQDIKNLDVENIFQDLSDHELQKRYQSMLTSAIEKGKLEKSPTFLAYQKEIGRRSRKDALENVVKGSERFMDKSKAKSEQIQTKILSLFYQKNERGLRNIQDKQKKRRVNNIAKWTTSVAAGGAMAYLIGKSAFDAGGEPEANVDKPEADPEPKMTKLEFDEQATETISGVETVEQGDNTWELVENQLEKREIFESLKGTPEEIEAKKDFIIDFYKDQIAENPEAFGINSGDASLLEIGEEVDLSSLMENEDLIGKVVNAAENLDKEALENIIENQDFIKDVLSKPVNEITDENLVKTVEMMGGESHAGPGLVGELSDRITEASIDLSEEARDIVEVKQAILENEVDLHENMQRLKELEEANSGIGGWFRRHFTDTELPDRISEAQADIDYQIEGLNEMQGDLAAEEVDLHNAAGRLSTLTDRSSEEILDNVDTSIRDSFGLEEEVGVDVPEGVEDIERGAEVVEGTEPVPDDIPDDIPEDVPEETSGDIPEEIEETETPVEETDVPEEVEETDIPEEEVGGTEGIEAEEIDEVSDLEGTNIKNPVEVEGGKIYQEAVGNKIVFDKGEGVRLKIFKDSVGNFHTEFHGYASPMSMEQSSLLTENVTQTLAAEAKPGLIKSTRIMNYVMEENIEAIEMAKEAGLEDSWVSNALHFRVRKILESFAENHGEDLMEKVFKPEVIKNFWGKEIPLSGN